jgi:CHAD domain-containing protein
VTVLALAPPADDDLASFDTSLQLGESEPLGVGVKRVTMEQLEHAADGFLGGQDRLGLAVHESRKSIKRIRALLRLIRGELPEKVFRFENGALRETAGLVDRVRSAQGVLNAATGVRELYGDLLAEGTFVDLIDRLTKRRDITELTALEDPNLVGRVVRSLERAYHRYQTWPTDPEAREVYGLGIRDSFEAIDPGLDRTYSTGRRRMVAAYSPSGEDGFHAWRKRVKDLRHQMEFLAPLWPEVVVGMAMTLDRLGTILGEDNDLRDLVDLLGTRSDLCPNPRERSLLRALARQRRAELETAAEILGRRVYAEKPKALCFRFGEYWGARQMALGGSFDTIVVY